VAFGEAAAAAPIPMYIIKKSNPNRIARIPQMVWRIPKSFKWSRSLFMVETPCGRFGLKRQSGGKPIAGARR
jgi:hypothetical protein